MKQKTIFSLIFSSTNIEDGYNNSKVIASFTDFQSAKSALKKHAKELLHDWDVLFNLDMFNEENPAYSEKTNNDDICVDFNDNFFSVFKFGYASECNDSLIIRQNTINLDDDNSFIDDTPNIYQTKTYPLNENNKGLESDNSQNGYQLDDIEMT